MMEFGAGKKIEVICSSCGVRFLRPKGTIREGQKAIFCTRECTRKTHEDKLLTRRLWRKKRDDENRESVRARAKKWRDENKDLVRAAKKRDYELHKEKRHETQRKYNEKNKNQRIIYRKKHYIENRDKLLAKSKEWSLANPERVKERGQKYWRENRAGKMLTQVRKNSKDNGMVCDMTYEWFQVRLDAGVCEMSGMPFDMESKRGPNSPSIDRIRAGAPYTRDNCRMILWSLNHALSNYGEDYVFSVFRNIFIKRGEMSA